MRNLIIKSIYLNANGNFTSTYSLFFSVSFLPQWSVLRKWGKVVKGSERTLISSLKRLCTSERNSFPSFIYSLKENARNEYPAAQHAICLYYVGFSSSTRMIKKNLLHKIPGFSWRATWRNARNSTRLVIIH